MSNDKNNKNNSSPLSDLLPIIIGEAIMAALTCLVFVVLDLSGIYRDFEYYKIILGAILGAIVIVVNHAVLIFSVDRKINKFVSEHPEGDMDDEAIAAITRKQTAEIQTAMKLSSMARTVSMLIVLVIAFITGWFSPIATAIPMLALRPILMVAELIKSKNNPKPDPSKFIKYEDEDENTEEKEDN